MSVNDERVYLDEGGIFVSRSRLVISGTTYSMANVTSVAKRKTSPNGGCAVALIGFGAVMAMVALGMFGGNGGDPVGTLVGALVVGGIGVLWYRSLKPTYHVFLASSSGEKAALSSPDEALISKVVAAVSEAIVSRG